MNVLILSASAKVLLVAAFREAVAPLGGQVVAADVTPDNAALLVADRAALLPRDDDPRFAAALTHLCKQQRIGLVVPTRDGELPVLAHLAADLRMVGATALVAAAPALAVCRDKRRFVAFCRDNDLPVPRTWAPGERPDAFPVFVRPICGAGGGDAGPIATAEAFDLATAGREMLVQERVQGHEYSVDVLMDLAGGPIQAIARTRLALRAGEAVKSRVEDRPDLAALGLSICARLGLVGHNVVQLFDTPAGPRLIEVNPRFGGASNLAIRAGLDSPMRIVQLLTCRHAEAVAPRPIRFGLTMLRHASDLLIDADTLAQVGRTVEAAP